MGDFRNQISDWREQPPSSKMKNPIPALLLAATIYIGLKPAAAQQLSRPQVEANVAAMRLLLLRSHPAAAQYCGLDSLDVAFRHIQNFTGDSLPRHEFEFRARQMLRQVGCGHTNIYTRLPKAAQKKLEATIQVFPYRVFTDGEKLWVRQPLDTSQRQIPTGAELLFLNGKTARQVVSKLAKHQIADGRAETMGRHTVNQGLYFNYFFRKYFPADTASCRVVWQTPDGRRDSAVLRPILAKLAEKSLAKTERAEAARRDSMLPPVAERLRAKSREFYFHPNFPAQQGGVGVLKIGSFRGRAPKFYKKVFSKLEEQKAAVLVVDLRNNLGGNYQDCMNLLRYMVREPMRVEASHDQHRTWKYMKLKDKIRRFNRLIFEKRGGRRCDGGKVFFTDKFKPRSKHHFDGQIFVLINGWSASGGSSVPSFLQKKAGAICIGEETGGGAQTMNAFIAPLCRLPHGRYLLAVPQYHLDLGLGKDSGRGVLPDVLVRYSISDVLARRDLEMETVLARLQK